MTSDSYKTVKSEAIAEIKIKGSRFIGQVYKCRTSEQAKAILDRIRKKYYDATHNCFAWQVGLDNAAEFKYSDDGEPNGTAGKPIYDQLNGYGLTDLIVIATRYYGGTKLGTGGLTHAYSDSAAAVIEEAGIVEKFITGQLGLEMDFSDYNIVERSVLDMGAKIIESNFSDKVTLTVEIRKSQLETVREKLIDITSGRIKIARTD
jgi:uncharacterized YigZ family protein